MPGGVARECGCTSDSLRPCYHTVPAVVERCAGKVAAVGIPPLRPTAVKAYHALEAKSVTSYEGLWTRISHNPD